MSTTRRRFLQAGAVTLSGFAIGGCRSDESTESPAVSYLDNPFLYTVNLKAPDKRLLTTFDGLCAFVAPPTGNAMDVALLSTEPVEKAIMKKMPDHYPTLVIPRNSIVGGDARPVSADVNHAYYSLDEVELTIEPFENAAMADALEINRQLLNKVCPKDNDHWNSFSWVLDFASEVQGGTLRSDWRTQPHVRTLVKLRSGVIEPAGLAKEEKGGSQNVRVWQLRDSRRALKEVVRHTLVAESYRLTMRPMSWRRNDRKVVPSEIHMRAGGSIDIGIMQLPVPFMGTMDRLEDLLACYFLLEGGGELLESSGRFVPSLVQDYICDSSATSQCGCCPLVQFVDQNWDI